MERSDAATDTPERTSVARFGKRTTGRNRSVFQTDNWNVPQKAYQAKSEHSRFGAKNPILPVRRQCRRFGLKGAKTRYPAGNW